MKKRVEPLRDLGKLHPLALEDLPEEGVAVDILSLVRVLELVGLDVLPQGRNDDRPCLSVQSKKPGQPLVQLELEWLVVQEEEDCAAHILVTWPLDLEPVGFLSVGVASPLHQVVVRAIQIFVQLNDQRLKTRNRNSNHFKRLYNTHWYVRGETK